MIHKIDQTKSFGNDIIQNFKKWENIEILISRISPKATLEKHSHNQPQIGFCLTNNFLFKIGQKESRIGKYDLYAIKGNVAHSAKNPSTKYCTAVDIKYYEEKEKIISQNKIIRNIRSYEDSGISLKASSFHENNLILNENQFIVFTQEKSNKIIIEEDIIDPKPFTIYQATNTTRIEIAKNNSAPINYLTITIK